MNTVLIAVLSLWRQLGRPLDPETDDRRAGDRGLQARQRPRLRREAAGGLPDADPAVGRLALGRVGRSRRRARHSAARPSTCISLRRCIPIHDCHAHASQHAILDFTLGLPDFACRFPARI